MCFCVNYLRSENFDQIFKLIFKFIIFPYAIQIGIGLQNVKMGVHCFLLVGIFIAQAQVLQHHPLPAVRLEIAILFFIKTMLLNQKKKLFCFVETDDISCCTIILDKSIDKKRLTVDLLFGVGRSSIGMQHPIGTAIFGIKKMLEYIVFCTFGILQIKLVFKMQRCR